MKFTYSSGQRPLDGYTLKRAIGRGGFGEVYYGITDGGKEVALKLVRGSQDIDIELRGVAQCLNLKHANLVNLFDLKKDAQGDYWVVMEYVAGESLSVVLQRHPQGLPPELAQQWFLALARAIGYLHDHGIVHRDLKPGNLFLENGTLKVGDYGLSKFMSGSQCQAQTQSVGTVHYMAPEISTGNYNKQIDIYAAGIILYEMLTGKVPFEGESAGEILMKHLTTPPDLSKLPADFVPVVARALAKNPLQRYASMAGMAKEIELIGATPPRAEPMRPRPIPRVPLPEPVLTALPALPAGGYVAELCGSLALTALFAAVSSTALAALASMTTVEIGSCFFLTVATCWAVLIPAKVWSGRRSDPWARRLVMMVLGILLGVGMLWLEGWIPRWPTTLTRGNLPEVAGYPGWRRACEALWPPGGGNLPEVAGYPSYFGLAFFAMRWWKLADRRRSKWFSFAPVLAAAFWGAILLMIPPHLWHGFIALVMASAIVQVVSPWEPAPRTAAKRVRLRCV